ncbi:hypothetical protein AAE478_000348 [Parahypoxylon ruwenzoriense]
METNSAHRNSLRKHLDRISIGDVVNEDNGVESPPLKRRKENNSRTRLGVTCRFTAPYRRGKPPVIEEGSYPVYSEMPQSQGPRISKNGENIDDVPENLGDQDAGTTLGSNLNVSRSQTSVIQSSRNSPEPLQTDRQGHIVGPSSGVSFLLRVQRKLVNQASHYSSESSIFTFGDLPLPEWDGSFFILHPKNEAKELLNRYFDFAVATHRFLHRRTMELWLEELYETGGKMRSKEGSRSRVALIFMMFAYAKRFSKSGGEDGSESRRSDTTNRDLVENECRKRTFWVAYSLDAYLSAAFGRPRAFHDEDINQDFPACVDDSDLDLDRLSAPVDRGLPEMAAPIAQLNVLREFYSLRTPSSKERIELAEKFTGELKQWRMDMSLLLDYQGASQSLLLPLFRRQRNVLNLAYWHTLLLIHRPFLLDNFASLSNYSTIRAKLPNHEDFENNVKQCLDAAIRITKITEELEERNQLHRAFWRNGQPDTYLPYFNAASECQSRIINNSRDGSWVQRYGMVLEELRLEVLRHNNSLSNGQAERTNAVPLGDAGFGDSTIGARGSMTQHNLFAGTLAGGDSALGAVGALGPLGEELTAISPSSSIVEMTAWGQFDSLITGGFGNFDALLADTDGNWAWT